MMPTRLDFPLVLAERPGQLLIQTGATTGRLANLRDRTLAPETALMNLAALGYWQDTAATMKDVEGFRAPG